MQHRKNIKDEAVGKWRSILPALGVPTSVLSGKHCPCPMCGGTDRFRFDDKAGLGTYYCNGCGAGSGIDLVMKLKGLNFVGAVQEIKSVLPNAEVKIEKASERRPFDPSEIWKRCHPVEARDPVGRYLASRKLALHTFPSQIRFNPRARYKHEDGEITYHPAMVSKFVSPDASEMTLQATYLTEDGQKANVPVVKKSAPAPIPKGGAVRLANSDEVMGIAEGVETALSASCLFGMPVWATYSASSLRLWEPPKTAKQIVVFADNDESYRGQSEAYTLAYRLRQLGLSVTVQIPEEPGTDFNDVWAELQT